MEEAWWNTMSNSVDMQLPQSLSQVARHPAYTRRITRVPRCAFRNPRAKLREFERCPDTGMPCYRSARR